MIHGRNIVPLTHCVSYLHGPRLVNWRAINSIDHTTNMAVMKGIGVGSYLNDAG